MRPDTIHVGAGLHVPVLRDSDNAIVRIGHVKYGSQLRALEKAQEMAKDPEGSSAGAMRPQMDEGNSTKNERLADD